MSWLGEVGCYAVALMLLGLAVMAGIGTWENGKEAKVAAAERDAKEKAWDDRERACMATPGCDVSKVEGERAAEERFADPVPSPFAVYASGTIGTWCLVVFGGGAGVLAVANTRDRLELRKKADGGSA